MPTSVIPGHTTTSGASGGPTKIGFETTIAGFEYGLDWHTPVKEKDKVVAHSLTTVSDGVVPLPELEENIPEGDTDQVAVVPKGTLLSV